jgi:hypothetical protein
MITVLITFHFSRQLIATTGALTVVGHGQISLEGETTMFKGRSPCQFLPAGVTPAIGRNLDSIC